MTNEKTTCIKCNETKSLVLFSRNRHTSSGYKASCKACDRIYRIENGDSIRMQQRKRRNTIEGRALRAYHKSLETTKKYGLSSTLTAEAVLDLYKSRSHCIYCDIAVGVGENVATISLEHIYSISTVLGGENHLSNVDIACLSCNKKKGDMHVYDFYVRHSFFTDELWHAFVSRFTSRLIGREINDAEVDEMTANLAAEAQARKEVKQNARIS